MCMMHDVSVSDSLLRPLRSTELALRHDTFCRLGRAFLAAIMAGGPVASDLAAPAVQACGLLARATRLHDGDGVRRFPRMKADRRRRQSDGARNPAASN